MFRLVSNLNIKAAVAQFVFLQNLNNVSYREVTPEYSRFIFIFVII